MDVLWDKVIEFHGHACCILAVGYRAARWAGDYLSPGGSEKLTAIVETADCSTDALQVVLGTTTGKRRLIVREAGKHVFIISADNKAVRLTFNRDILTRSGEEFTALMTAVANGTASAAEKEAFYRMQEPLMNYILAAPHEELFTTEEVEPVITNPGFDFVSV